MRLEENEGEVGRGLSDDGWLAEAPHLAVEDAGITRLELQLERLVLLPLFGLSRKERRSLLNERLSRERVVVLLCVDSEVRKARRTMQGPVRGCWRDGGVAAWLWPRTCAVTGREVWEFGFGTHEVELSDLDALGELVVVVQLPLSAVKVDPREDLSAAVWRAEGTVSQRRDRGGICELRACSPLALLRCE